MAFQKCPVCEGSGKSTTEFGGTCHVCQGYGIINELNGQPPKKTVVTTNTSDNYYLQDAYEHFQRRYGNFKTDMFNPEKIKWRKDKCKCSGTSYKCVPIKTEE